jgi:hypothetical protein
MQFEPASREQSRSTLPGTPWRPGVEEHVFPHARTYHTPPPRLTVMSRTPVAGHGLNIEHIRNNVKDYFALTENTLDTGLVGRALTFPPPPKRATAGPFLSR